ncbi:uncharacterized protein LOC111698806 [Eurytemora carolleeae]|uniref:uncharacterized protein LOC111698806 n=1 Tax=Eurytemora carolleeae TaxID=1294199 RepID=UPI000C77D412|nr:uncharacterized protein LOC111698806 [Eurytemora carolleeae]|eukprot:XP_023325017.1 uncharacterized protein LOC111698806 [Eurytemora affinis]
MLKSVEMIGNMAGSNNSLQYEYIIENILNQDRKDLMLVKFTVPIILVGLFIIIILIIYLKCGKKPKKCTVLRRESTKSLRTDGTVKSNWRQVRTRTLRDRKLPPIPEEQTQGDKGRMTSQGFKPSGHIIGTATPESHVYAEINGTVDISEETVENLNQTEIDLRSKYLQVPNVPDVVQHYVNLPDIASDRVAENDDIGTYVPYTYPYQHKPVLNRDSTEQEEGSDSCKLYSSPIPESAVSESSSSSIIPESTSKSSEHFPGPEELPTESYYLIPNSTISESTSTFPESLSATAIPEYTSRSESNRNSQIPESSSSPVTAESASPSSIPESTLTSSIPESASNSATLTLSSNHQVEEETKNKNSNKSEFGKGSQLRVLPRLRESISLDSGCTTNLSPGAGRRQLKRLKDRRHDKKERARMLSSVQLRLARSDSFSEFYSTF